MKLCQEVADEESSNQKECQDIMIYNSLMTKTCISYPNYKDNDSLESNQHNRIHHPYFYRKMLFMDTANENLGQVLGYLDGVSLCSIKQTCHLLNSIGNNDKYWRTLCLAEWGVCLQSVLLTASNSKSMNYQNLYKASLLMFKRLAREIIEEQCLVSMQKRFSIPMDVASSILQTIQ